MTCQERLISSRVPGLGLRQSSNTSLLSDDQGEMKAAFSVKAVSFFFCQDCPLHS